MIKEMACRKCKYITRAKICQICKSSDLSHDWSGIVLVVDVNNSQIARSLGITKEGKYALKVI